MAVMGLLDSRMPAAFSESEADALLLRNLVENGVRIPTQSRLVAEMARQLMAPEIDLRIVAATLRQEPRLVEELLCLSGHAAGVPRQVSSSVEDLLAGIGVRRTFNLVRALSLSRAISGDAEQPCDHEHFWSRARSMAELAMLVAHERHAKCGVFPDEAYLAGLFMDCGVPVLMQRFAAYCADVTPGCAGAWPDVMEEDRKVNGDHALIGYFVAYRWQLPDVVCQAVRFHHRIDRAREHSAAAVVAILNLARYLWHCHHGTDDTGWQDRAGATFSELALEGDTRFAVMNRVLARFRATLA